MKFEKAMAIINTKRQPKGYMVHFEKVNGSILVSDYFPDKHAEEPLIKTEFEAWTLAQKFANATEPKEYINIYVINEKFEPVNGYFEKTIRRYIIKEHSK
jgi:hypothetical protein